LMWPARRPQNNLADMRRVALMAGPRAAEGRRMGHAGAIVSGGRGTAASKVAALEAAGFRVAGSPTELPALLREAGYRG
jgi:succinyl-CoA synthetase alpha subunit